MNKNDTLSRKTKIISWKRKFFDDLGLLEKNVGFGALGLSLNQEKKDTRISRIGCNYFLNQEKRM